MTKKITKESTIERKIKAERIDENNIINYKRNSHMRSHHDKNEKLIEYVHVGNTGI